jgi:hypothetical protein
MDDGQPELIGRDLSFLFITRRAWSVSNRRMLLRKRVSELVGVDLAVNLCWDDTPTFFGDGPIFLGANDQDTDWRAW